MSTGEEESTESRLSALDARMKVIEGSLTEILDKVTQACEAAGIAAASAPPAGKRRRHLTVVKGLLAGGAAWAGLRKLLAGTAVAGVLTAGAVSAITLLPSASPAVPPAVAAPAPVTFWPVPAAARPAVAHPRRHHGGAAVLAAAGSTPATSQSPASLVTVSPSPSGSGSVSVKVPVPVPSPLSSPACVDLPVLPGICVSL